MQTTTTNAITNMNNMDGIIIRFENEQMLVTSLQVAKDFGKEHRNVLRDIESLKDVLNFEQMFNQTNIPDSYGRDRKAYLINRDGFTLLAMGFTGKDALEWKLKYIRAFNEMETKLNSPEFIMNRALEISKQRCDALLLEIQKLKPKEIFADAVSTSSESILIGQLAKLIRQNGYDIGQNRLFSWMRENGYLIKSGSRYNQPTQKAMNLELFEVKERVLQNPDGSTKITLTTKVTGKGQIYFVNKFLEC